MNEIILREMSKILLRERRQRAREDDALRAVARPRERASARRRADRHAVCPTPRQIAY